MSQKYLRVKLSLLEVQKNIKGPIRHFLRFQRIFQGQGKTKESLGEVQYNISGSLIFWDLKIFEGQSEPCWGPNKYFRVNSSLLEIPKIYLRVNRVLFRSQKIFKGRIESCWGPKKIFKDQIRHFLRSQRIFQGHSEPSWSPKKNIWGPRWALLRSQIIFQGQSSLLEIPKIYLRVKSKNMKGLKWALVRS